MSENDWNSSVCVELIIYAFRPAAVSLKTSWIKNMGLTFTIFQGINSFMRVLVRFLCKVIGVKLLRISSDDAYLCSWVNELIDYPLS